MKAERLTILLTILLLASACWPEGHYTPEFLQDSTLRLYVGDEEILSYDPYDCQYAYNRERLEFRLHTDNMSEYVLLSLDEEPTYENQVVTASSIRWTRDNGSDVIKKDIALEVVKVEGDVVWLWNSRESLKMTARFR